MTKPSEGSKDIENMYDGIIVGEYTRDQAIAILNNIQTAEIRKTLERLKERQTIMSHVTYDFGTALEVGQDKVVPLSAIDNEIKSLEER